MTDRRRFDVAVIGAGPAGTAAAIRASELGASTALITRDAFGGMAANEGPIPVRTLAHAARLEREARQLHRYGIRVSTPKLDYSQLVSRAREVVAEAREHSTLLDRVRQAGATLFEHAGSARFTRPHEIVCEQGLAVTASSIVLCTGGISRPLNVRGGHLAVSPSDAFALTTAPQSMIVVGAGATGVQVASIFNAFGCSVALCQAGPRIIPTEDEDVSAEVARAFREDGMAVHENFGRIEEIESLNDGVRVVVDGSFLKARLVVSAIGWVADTRGLCLEVTGARTNERGFVSVDKGMRTTADHVWAAGDVVGHAMLVPQAVRDGYVAGNNAVSHEQIQVPGGPEPIGSFTDPEYAKVGMTEEQARVKYDVVTARAEYAETTRPVIDGRTRGFCKLVIDRRDLRLLGCHIVGERAVEVAQIAAVAMAGGLPVTQLAQLPLSFPTYANAFGRAALRAMRELGLSPLIDV